MERNGSQAEDGGTAPSVKVLGLRLTSFTAFVDVDFAFGAGINCLIGENGTGKTHTLKVLRSALSTAHDRDSDTFHGPDFWRKLYRLFVFASGDESALITHGASKSHITLKSDAGTFEFTLNRAEASNESPVAGSVGIRIQVSNISLIPAEDFLAHYRNFLAWYEERQIDFDESYYDIAKQITREPLRQVDPRINALLNRLPGIIDQDTFEMDKDGVYFKSDAQRIELPFTALGHRKFALLYFLLRNGSIRPGSVLLWDEPDANLNPKLIGALVEILLELQRCDVQVFLATHSYVFLKELDLRLQSGDNVRYHSLFRDPARDNDISCHSTDQLVDLDPNPILETYSSLYDRQIRRSLGDLVRKSE